MTPERWAQIEELFHRAAEADTASRHKLLDEACSSDYELRKEVEALLDRDGRAADKMQASIRSEFQNIAFPLIGKTVSHYQILEGLGGGGMGLVYRAQDIKLPRSVAIKFLPEDSANDPDALRRFEREARAASALEHANICPIYEFGEHEGLPFIVMPLFDGQTLEQFIHAQGAAKGSQQMQKLLDISIQVLKGLGAAHEHGIIHRDVKPGNIFLTNNGEAKILDFGIAKLMGADQQRDHLVHGDSETVMAKAPDLTFSRTGAIVGTAAYMSPEQVRGEQVDTRTDIFSFGLVLYELATGKRAFGGSTWPVLQEAVLTGTPKPARGLNPEIPIKLEQIINKAIEKDREARYQTAAEMRTDLEELQRQLAPRHLPRAWAIGLAAAGAVVAGILLWVLNRPPKTLSIVPEIKLRQLTTNSSENPVIGGAISPDGKYLAYSDTRGMHLKVLDSGETRNIPEPEELKGQHTKWGVGIWFPDSLRFLANAYPATEEWNEWNSNTSSIWSVPLLGGAPTKLRDHAIGCAVSPDGSTISFGANHNKYGEREVWLMGPHGEQARKYYEAKPGASAGCWGWTADGKYFITVLADESGGRGVSRSVQGGSFVTLLGDSELQKTNDFVWLHDGRVVYDLAETDTGVCNYWIGRIDPGTGKRLESPRRLTNWPNFCVASGSVSNDDKKLTFMAMSAFFTPYVGELEAGGKRLREIRHFALEEGDIYPLDWTPDSRSVIITRHRRPDKYDLYTQSLDSDTTESLSSGGVGWLNMGIVSPDGKWIIARTITQSESDNPPASRQPIVRFPISGGNPETVLELSHVALASCARPPSRTCVIAEPSDNNKEMVVSLLDPIKGRGPELARFDFDRQVEWFLDNLMCFISPDGKRLAITRSPQGIVEIYSLHGKLLQKIPSLPLGKILWLAWAPDLKGFFVTRRIQDDGELLHLDFRGHTESLRRCVGPWCTGLPSPDGKYLAIIDHSQRHNMWMMENF